MLALDCAATEFFKDGVYDYSGEGVKRSIAEQADYLAQLSSRRDSSDRLDREDGLSEDRFRGLEAAHRQGWQEGATRRRRPVRHQHRTSVDGYRE